MSGLSKLDPSYPVERSRLLDSFDFSTYTPDELLLLDVYLSKINPNDPSTKRVQFRKRDYEEFLERNEQKAMTFKRAAVGLFMKVVDPNYLPTDIAFKPRHLWEDISFEKEGGEWVFTLECAKEAESFFFDTKKYGFIRYLVGYTKRFSSKYSYIMYYFLKRKRQEEQRFGNPIRPTVVELKKITGTTTKKTYNEFKYFRRDIIERPIAEINEFTDIEVGYELIRNGGRGKVERIEFTVSEKKTPPLLDSGAGEPSSDLKEMFAEELLEAACPTPEPELDTKIMVQLSDGQTVWIDRNVIMSLAGTEQQENLEAPKKRRGRPKKEQLAEAVPEPETQTTSSPEPEPEPLTELEQDLFRTVPEEVHGDEIERVRAIQSVAARYIHERFLDFFDEGVSYAEARRLTIEDCNNRTLDAVRRYITEDYNVRRKGIRSPAGHYRYFLIGFEGWLMSHMDNMED